MSIAKPIYKMTIDLATFRTDALKDTLDRIRELTSDQEKTIAGELKIKATIEGDNLAGLQSIRNQLEIYLRRQQTGLVSGTVDIKEPLVRPAPEPTPMDELFEDEAASSDATPGERVMEWLVARETR